MQLQFTKMHGLGNDMIVINALRARFVPTAKQARFLCDRRHGIGADQILVLLPSKKADFRMRIFNADGSEVEMCGNGIRCLALYIRDRRLSQKKALSIETLAGTIRPEIVGKKVRVDMGEPVFEPVCIPVKIKGKNKVQERLLRIDDDTFRMSAVSMGNPHCVIPVENADAVPLEMIGPRIEHHPCFPKRTNVEFVQVMSRTRLKVRVWERGAGATLACGTGACAAAVAMIDLDKTDRKVTVTLPGGDLEIKWDPKTNHVWMTGPAVEVYNGTIHL